MGFSRQENWSGFPFPSPVDHILSELSTMTHPSWVALHSKAHSFIELDKAVVHVIRLVSFLWLWFSVCPPSDGEGSEAYGSFLMGETDWGGNWVLFWWAGPWTVWKGKKIGHWNMNSPGPYVPNMLLEISGEITPERMKRWSQSKNNTQLWMWLVMEAKSNAVKSNIA